MKYGEISRLLTRCGYHNIGVDGQGHQRWTNGEETFQMTSRSDRGFSHALSQRLKKIEQRYDLEQHQLRLERSNRKERRLTAGEAKPGAPVKSLVDFADVPRGTSGVIEEDYGRGFTVRWNLPFHPPLRDGFDRTFELAFLGPA